MSIILLMPNHIVLNGGGSGSGFLAIRILSRLHILSYAKVMAGNLDGPSYSCANDNSH